LKDLLSEWRRVYEIRGTFRLGMWHGSFTIAKLLSCGAWPGDIVAVRSRNSKRDDNYFRLVANSPTTKEIKRYMKRFGEEMNASAQAAAQAKRRDEWENDASITHKVALTPASSQHGPSWALGPGPASGLGRAKGQGRPGPGQSQGQGQGQGQVQARLRVRQGQGQGRARARAGPGQARARARPGQGQGQGI
jgi:hypothetical protein